jgi:hypothetical protein
VSNPRSVNMIAFGERVRTRTDRSGPGEHFEVVEQLTDGQWVEVKRFGHMSDDYALTHARELAQSLARQATGGH